MDEGKIGWAEVVITNYVTLSQLTLSQIQIGFSGLVVWLNAWFYSCRYCGWPATVPNLANPN